MFEVTEQKVRLFFGCHHEWQFAEALGMSARQLTYLRNTLQQYPEELYRSSLIRKRRPGAYRKISAPRADLKEVQRRMARLLQARYRPPRNVHGFVPGRGIVTNAQPHAGKRCVLTIDLQDFFPSIGPRLVFNCLIGRPYHMSSPAALLCAQLSCYHDQLPQGAPSSPVLSNMVMSNLDQRLTRAAREFSLYYTRYADDLTFSTNHAYISRDAIARILEEIEARDATYAGARTGERSPFCANPAKISLRRAGARHQVTGLTVNERVNVSRTYLKNLRAALFQAEPAPESSRTDDIIRSLGAIPLQAHESSESRLYRAAARSPQFSATIARITEEYQTGLTVPGEVSFQHAVAQRYLQHLRGRVEFVRQVLGENSGQYVTLKKRFDTIAEAAQAAGITAPDHEVSLHFAPPYYPAPSQSIRFSC